MKQSFMLDAKEMDCLRLLLCDLEISLADRRFQIWKLHVIVLGLKGQMLSFEMFPTIVDELHENSNWLIHFELE